MAHNYIFSCGNLNCQPNCYFNHKLNLLNSKFHFKYICLVGSKTFVVKFSEEEFYVLPAGATSCGNSSGKKGFGLCICTYMYICMYSYAKEPFKGNVRRVLTKV
jgi:hypothetical protein